MFFKLKFFSESKFIDERILGYESGDLWFYDDEKKQR
jgi:hypothetical protein